MVSGRIPKTLVQLPHLTFLRIGNNRLTGPLPAELAQLPPDNSPGIQVLRLAENQLTGTVPSLPITLSTLDISSNYFRGQVPDLSQHQALTTLLIHGNEFT